MTEWNERHLEELVRKMGLRRTPGQGKIPIHLSLYGPSPRSEPLLTKIMRLDANEWAALGYDETDRVSVVQYLGSLGCRADRAWLIAVWCQQPLSLELAKPLINAGCDLAAQDGTGWDALVWLADGGHPVDPRVTDLFLSAGCRTDLDGCRLVDDEHRIRFDQILKEHAEWKESLDRMSLENVPTNLAVDWNR